MERERRERERVAVGEEKEEEGRGRQHITGVGMHGSCLCTKCMLQGHRQDNRGGKAVLFHSIK